MRWVGGAEEEFRSLLLSKTPSRRAIPILLKPLIRNRSAGSVPAEASVNGLNFSSVEQGSRVEKNEIG
jgi:hypothetical protein